MACHKAKLYSDWLQRNKKSSPKPVHKMRITQLLTKDFPTHMPTAVYTDKKWEMSSLIKQLAKGSGTSLPITYATAP